MLHARSLNLRLFGAALFCVACAAAPANSSTAALSPQTALDELLAADRAFSAASARTDLITGLSAMFADDITMPLPNGTFAEGATKVVEALRANPMNATARIEWTPIRGGISADGQHGFTFGYMTMQRPDSAPLPAKYLSYWVKGPQGWRVAAYRRGRAAPGERSMAMMPPSLPPRAVPASNDEAQIARYRTSVMEAENTFSREAQTMGIGPAFAKHGSSDAVNMGGGSAFTVSAEAIGRAIGGGDGPGTPSPVTWGADKALVASSGDLGVTFGVIRENKPSAQSGTATGITFFTVWRRASPSEPWRYIAE